MSKHKNSSFELSPIKAMELAASKLQDVISLAQGIPSFATPQVIRDFVHQRIEQGLCDKYSLTIGLSELREEISLALQKEGLSYDPETEVVVTVGSIEGLTASILSCTSPGDEVLLPSPTYASYRGALGIAGCIPRYVELDEDSNFDFHVEKVKSAITKKTSALLYCSPNNPTGTMFSEDKTKKIIDLAEQHNLTVIIDEVYKDFYYADDKHYTPVKIAAARDRIIRVCSFSKAYAMTGWRVGFVHSSQNRIKRLLKFHDAMVTCAPVVSQYAAIAALRYGQPFLDEFRKEFKKRRDYTIGMLDQMSTVLDYQMPKATYFVFPRIKDSFPMARDSQQLAYDILDKVRVALVPGVAFGPSGESHLRIMYGREWPELKAGMERLADYFCGNKAKFNNNAAAKVDYSKNCQLVAPKVASWQSRIALPLIRCACKLYLSRSKPLVIGVLGTRGKTVYKRVIAEVLNLSFKTRASILSYNTAIGLPLAVLGIPSPKSKIEKLSFPLELLIKTFFSNSEIEVLVLEYGIASQGDAKALLKAVKPDWIILGDIDSTDPNITSELIRRELLQLLKPIPTERILWSSEDSTIETLGLNLKAHLGFKPDDITDSSLNSGKSIYKLGHEYVGRSARLAIIAAIKLAENLGVSNKTLVEYLQKRA